MGYRSKTKSIQPKQRGLILCEGETEENYFKSLVLHQKNKTKLAAVAVEIYKPKNHSPRGLLTEEKTRIKSANREQNPYNFIYVVFDRDGHSDISHAFHEIDTFKGKPAIGKAFTVICFEFYVLLHFEKTTKPFNNCDDTISYLKKYIPKYEKATNLYEALFDYKEFAYENCEFIIKHVQNDIERGLNVYDLPFYCNVHHLVKYLQEL